MIIFQQVNKKNLQVYNLRCIRHPLCLGSLSVTSETVKNGKARHCHEPSILEVHRYKFITRCRDKVVNTNASIRDIYNEEMER